jgi:predicted ABC-type ATPase
LTHPQCVVIAGPNGAGKSSAAPELLKDTAGVATFVNADVIAQGLAAFRPEDVAIAAGRIMLARIAELMEAGLDFAFETTLSGRSVHRLLAGAVERGYRVHVCYIWLPSADMAVARVAQRVAAGGHHVPEAVVRRRFRRSLASAGRLSTMGATTWRIFDGSGVGPPQLGGVRRGRWSNHRA